MKTFLLISSLLALAFGGCSKQEADNAMDKTKAAADTAMDKTKAAAIKVKNAVSEKITEWHLTAPELKADLENGGRIVRTKGAIAGAKVASAADDARIVTVINGKLVAEPDLSALKIDVDADNGVVTLKGSAKSPEAVGKAVALALDTDGVTQVTSLLTVQK